MKMNHKMAETMFKMIDILQEYRNNESLQETMYERLTISLAIAARFSVGYISEQIEIIQGLSGGNESFSEPSLFLGPLLEDFETMVKRDFENFQKFRTELKKSREGQT